MTLITHEHNYKFEVAFSFLQEDESLAYKIKDLIQDRLSTFIYSEHQKEAVGQDGVEAYTRVFHNDSRIVVVLFREGWGATSFTRIEESAIKQRGFKESFDFVVFISLDKKKPNWLSDLQIWYDFDRYGIKSAASTIENRVLMYGGQIQEETIEDQVARHNREILRQKEFEKYIKSKEALQDGLSEKENLFKIFEENILSINRNNEIHLNFGILKEDYDNKITMYGSKIGLTFNWKPRYSDSILESYLSVFIANSKYYDGGPNRLGGILKQEEYVFYLNEAKTKGWAIRNNKEEFKTTEQIVAFWQKDFLERTRLERLEESKRNSIY